MSGVVSGLKRMTASQYLAIFLLKLQMINLKPEGQIRGKCIFSILYYYNVKTFMNNYNSLIKGVTDFFF